MLSYWKAIGFFMDFTKTIAVIAKVFAITLASYFMCLVTLGLVIVLFAKVILHLDPGTHGFFTWTSWPMDLTRIFLKVGVPSYVIGFSLIGRALPKSRRHFCWLGFLLSIPMILFHIGYGHWTIQRETIPYLIAFAVSGLVFGLFWWLTFHTTGLLGPMKIFTREDD